jgi:hypothetical protein
VWPERRQRIQCSEQRWELLLGIGREERRQGGQPAPESDPTQEGLQALRRPVDEGEQHELRFIVIHQPQRVRNGCTHFDSIGRLPCSMSEI